MNWEQVKDLLELLIRELLTPELLIPLGGLGVALMSVFRVTSFPLQQALHSRQIDLCLDAVDKVAMWQDGLFFLIKQHTAGNNEALTQLRNAMGKHITKLLYDMSRLGVVLPRTAMDSLGNYACVAIRLHQPESGFAERLAKFQSDDDDTMVRTFVEFVEATRKSLGVDALSEETQKLLRKVGP